MERDPRLATASVPLKALAIASLTPFRERVDDPD
jgi:hypothetical protein